MPIKLPMQAAVLPISLCMSLDKEKLETLVSQGFPAYQGLP